MTRSAGSVMRGATCPIPSGDHSYRELKTTRRSVPSFRGGGTFCSTGYLDGEITCTGRPASPPVNVSPLNTVPSDPRNPENDRNSVGDQRSHREHENGVHRYAPKLPTPTLRVGCDGCQSHDTSGRGEILSYSHRVCLWVPFPVDA